MTLRRTLALATAALGFAVVVAGCGGSSSTSQPSLPAVVPAKTYGLDAFSPARAVPAGKPVTVSFFVRQPSGQPLTSFRRGSGPHTGVHLIMVREDLGAIIHEHPPIGPNGRLAATVTFPTPGRYRVVVDVYPATEVSGLPNFQLFRWITVAGKTPPKPPVAGPSETVDGMHFVASGLSGLKAIQPAFVTVKAVAANGRPATFTPWFGALAHAIFFRAGTLDYFHTHVCGRGLTGCASTAVGARISGSSTAPGVLRVGVLVPVAGRWRLFLQTKIDGHVVTVPFDLTVG